MFVHKLLELPNLSTEEVGGKRFYKIPGGLHYPSVTTILASEAKEHLQEWRARIGEEEAAKQTRYAAERGTQVHKLAEQLVNNEDIDLRRINPFIKPLFVPLRDYFIANLTEVWATEATVYSHRLRIAGRTDIIGIIEGEPTIIDIKTSNKVKQVDWIKGYFMQVAAYSYCVKELLGLLINKYAICIVDEQTYQLRVHKGVCSDHLQDFYKLRKRFDEETNSSLRTTPISTN